MHATGISPNNASNTNALAQENGILATNLLKKQTKNSTETTNKKEELKMLLR